MASNMESTRDSTDLMIEELQRETQVTDQQLDTGIEQINLPILASYFDNINDGYLQRMNLSPGQQTDVRKREHVEGTLAAMILALTLWLKCQVRGTFRALIVILLSLSKQSIVVQVFKYLSKKDLTQPQERNPKLSSYRDYLQSLYRALTPKSISQWPPVRAKKIINLAMIKKEQIQSGRIEDEFVRQTITGKVEDILHQKTPVELKNILSDTKTGQKIVLIEGAPGSGKSTLALHICQEWAEGRLFQEFDVAILVRLRDPIIKDARTIADLLPCVDRTMAIEQETVIKSLYGKGVLWVLDGWDELPSDLPQDSIINKLIQSEMSRESPLHKSTVIVTSRPSSSAELHPLVSSRVEVLGFTPRQLKQYFTECLNGDLQAVQTLLDRIQENPVVEGSCYLPLNAAIVVNCFLCENHSLPTSNHGIFKSVVQNSLKRYLQDRLGKTTPVGNITSPDSLPSELCKPFVQMCQLAYHGINQNKATFTHEDFTTLSIPKVISDIGLVQQVSSMLGVGSLVYYCFLQLSIQELLAAIHISLMSPGEQISVFEKLFGQPRFNAVFQFYAGITKLRIERRFLSKLPKFLHPYPTAILDLVRKIIQSECEFKIENLWGGEPKPLLLSLMYCLYEAEDLSLCEFVADVLNHKLDLSYNTMNPIDYLSVGYFASLTTKPFTLNLSGCSIGDQDCKFLAQGLLKCPHSQCKLTLDLTDNSIHDEGIHHIAKVLTNTTTLSKINLRNNTIGNSGSIPLCEALSINSSLTHLELSGCSPTIKDDSHQILRRFEHPSGFRRKLVQVRSDLIDTGRIFNDHGAIPQLLRTNTTLQFLGLSHNIITNTELSNLCDALSINTSLTHLDLSSCSFFSYFDKSVREPFRETIDLLQPLNLSLISQPLRTNTSLQSLNLSYNTIDDSTLSNLCDALSTNTTLKTLYLKDCSLTISADNGATLYQLLSQNNSLEALSLSDNKVTSCHHIAAGLAVNIIIKKIDLANCELTNHSIKQLSSGLINNIEYLDISKNDSITEDGMKTLATHLITNCPKLQTLYIPIEFPFIETNKKRKRNKLTEIHAELVNYTPLYRRYRQYRYNRYEPYTQEHILFDM